MRWTSWNRCERHQFVVWPPFNISQAFVLKELLIVQQIGQVRARDGEAAVCRTAWRKGPVYELPRVRFKKASRKMTPTLSVGKIDLVQLRKMIRFLVALANSTTVLKSHFCKSVTDYKKRHTLKNEISSWILTFILSKFDRVLLTLMVNLVRQNIF